MENHLGEKIHALRQDYRAATLDIADVSDSPFAQFEHWLTAAIASNCPEPNAFTLATVAKSGKPSARIVLLKGFDEHGFVFFTNYESKKGQQIAENPNVAMCFLWHELERQVRIEGIAEPVEREVSAAYFHSRPRKSQLGALASPQSQVVVNRAFLEQKMNDLLEKYDQNDQIVPYPTHWGGYRIRPTRIEFWQGRRSRLHDRIVFDVQQDGSWKIERLAP